MGRNYTRKGIKKGPDIVTGTLHWNGRESVDSLPSGVILLQDILQKLLHRLCKIYTESLLQFFDTT